MKTEHTHTEHLVSLTLFFQGVRVEKIVNMRYFKQAYYNENTLILEFTEQRFYHQCEKELIPLNYLNRKLCESRIVNLRILEKE